MTLHRLLRRIAGILTLALAGSVLILGSAQARATTLYATSISGSQIDQVDTVANTANLFTNTPSAADSIMFDTMGRVIYSQLYTGQVRRYDPNTAVDIQVSAGYSYPADIVMEPGGNSMLVSEFGGGIIDRINLTTFASSQLVVTGGTPEGLIYVGNRLFANLGNRYGGPTGKYVAELNPITGATIAVSPGLDSLDGLTYDPYSHLLYATSTYSSAVYSLDPNNLNNVGNVASHLGSLPGSDGIAADGLGNLFIVGLDQYVYQLDLSNNTLTQKNFVTGLDDLAPAIGDGSYPTPEPSTLMILGAGAGVLIRRRSKR